MPLIIDTRDHYGKTSLALYEPDENGVGLAIKDSELPKAAVIWLQPEQVLQVIDFLRRTLPLDKR